MTVLQWCCLFSVLTATTQLHVQTPELTEQEAPEGPGTGMMGFGGLFEAVDGMREEMKQAKQAEQEESNLIGHGRKSGESLSRGHESGEGWPKGSWKALMKPDDNYGPKTDGPRYPMSDSRQCSDEDMKVIHYWALKQAKARLPKEGRNGTIFKSGTCFKNNANKWIGLHVPSWAKCYQKFYNVSTPCAMCIGSVYQMATLNMSEPCYRFCHGRPSRRDGAHWCWEDCQSCMWYVGHKLSTCYGEPYDMVCRYAKELGKEHWFERNGIDTNDR